MGSRADHHYYEGQRGEVSFFFVGGLSEADWRKHAVRGREILVMLMSQGVEWQLVPYDTAMQRAMDLCEAANAIVHGQSSAVSTVEQEHMVATIESTMFTGHDLVKVLFSHSLISHSSTGKHVPKP